MIKWSFNMSNLSNEARRTAIKKSIIEASNSLLQAKAHQDHAKEVIKHVAEEYEMDKSVVAQLVKIYHKQNVNEVKEKSDTIVDEYETIFG